MRWFTLYTSLALLSPALGACGPDEPANEPLPIPDGCQPLLGGHDCLLPYPSDFFRVADPSLPSGARIEIGGAAKMLTNERKSADIHEWRRFDGYSRAPFIVAALPSPVSADGLVGILDDPAKSLAADSKTIILDAESKQRIPHFVDLDPRVKDPSRNGIAIHPLVRLMPLRRYVVALRGITSAPGGPLAPPAEGFRRLRDGEAAGEPSLEAIEARFSAEVLAPLEAAGIARDGLQLAFSFTTQSEGWVSRDMMRVRELTLAWLSEHPLTVRIDEVLEDHSREAWRTIEGEIWVPLFLEHTRPGGHLVRDAAGGVVQTGSTAVPFVAIVPRSLKDAAAPGRVLGYGHGFFGERVDMTRDGPNRKMVDRLQMVSFAIDWWGLAKRDLIDVTAAVSAEPWRAADFSDRVHQAMANWIVMTAAIEGPLGEQPAFRRPGTGERLYDPSSINFIGLSAGGILGGVLAAVHPRLDRVCLHVGGSGFGHLMTRARPFQPFLTLLDYTLPDVLDQLKLVATLQTALDGIDPDTYAEHVLRSPLPGSRPRKLLLQGGLGDTQVPNLGTFMHARSLGVPLLTPSPAKVYGLEEVTSPHSGSALALYDFGIDLAEIYGQAIAGPFQNEVHDGVRALDPAIEQLDRFFRPDGAIVNACDGACDPQ